MENRNQFCKVVIGLFLLAVLIVGCSSPNLDENADDLSGWIGNYEYGASFPPAIPTGTTLYETYTVDIYQNSDIYLADITANGWMLGINARAQIQGDERSIELVFLEYPDASMELFQQGDVILKFTKDGEDIITQWIGIAPELGANEGAEGIYFIKGES